MLGLLSGDGGKVIFHPPVQLVGVLQPGDKGFRPRRVSYEQLLAGSGEVSPGLTLVTDLFFLEVELAQHLIDPDH